MVACFSFLSFIGTSLLWAFLTYKFVSSGPPRPRIPHELRRRHFQARDGPKEVAPAAQKPQDAGEIGGEIDFSTGLRPDLFSRSRSADIMAILNGMDKMADEADMAETASLSHSVQLPSTRGGSRISDHEDHSFKERCFEKVNPFPILVYNLLVADMIEATGFSLSLTWLIRDAIHAPSANCWAQGFFGSVSNLATALFLTAISTTSFLTIVLGYRLPRWGLYACIGMIWTFSSGINAAGALYAEPAEPFIMRANAWVRMPVSFRS